MRVFTKLAELTPRFSDMSTAAAVATSSSTTTTQAAVASTQATTTTSDAVDATASTGTIATKSAKTTAADCEPLRWHSSARSPRSR